MRDDAEWPGRAAGQAPPVRGEGHDDPARVDERAPGAGPSGANADWDGLVTAALLGAERRPPPGGSVTVLLDTAAAETVRRRAGLRPAPARARPVPAPAEPRPPLPGPAALRLAALLAGRSGTGAGGRDRGTAPDMGELLPQWLDAAESYGYAAPADLLPALLDAARSRTDLRAAALSLAGPRALWLARLNPEWAFALRHGPRPCAAKTATGAEAAEGTAGGTSAGAGTEAGVTGITGVTGIDAGAGAEREESEASVRALWEEGLSGERLGLLVSVRRRSPSEGLQLLAGTWDSERAEDRLMFLGSLREGLSPADEPFLERALGDRSRTVRATAAELLAALPGSAFAARMAGRCLAHIGLDPRTAVPRIVIDPPRECDTAMQRDGVTSVPPTGVGERAWWLGQLVEAAPLSVWRDRFGGRTPVEIMTLPVADDWQPDLHAAWCRAAVRQGDAEWARALIGPPTTPLTERPGDPAALLAVLPEEERAGWTGQFIAAHGLSEAFRVVEACAEPWAEPLGRAVVDALEIARDAGSYPWNFSRITGLAERCLAPADADRLEPLTAVPDEPEDGAPGAGAYWAEAFQRLVGTLRLRAAMFAELREGTREHTEATDEEADREEATAS